MLRGFRWQFAALLLAAVVFVAALLTRSNTPPTVTDATATPPDISQPVSDPIQPTLPPVEVQPVQSSSGVIPTYREALIGTVQRINPLFADMNPVDRDITSLIYEGLTRTNTYGEVEPALAERWVISADGLEYVVFLRQDVLWQDGTPFTAADVAYTMSLLRDPNFSGTPELGEFWRTVETEPIDQFLVRFRLTQPLGTFLDKLRVGILPEHALRGTNALGLTSHPINFAPIGTGPYQLENIQTENGAVRIVNLRVAPVFRARREGQAQPYAVERIAFHLYDSFDAALNALQTGAVDGLAGRDRNERAPMFQAAIANNLLINNGLEPTVGMIVFNWAQESTRFFREQRVRVALDTGVDREALISRAMFNLALPADSPIIRGSWAYQPDLPQPAFNVASARQLLQTAAERLDRLNGDNASEATAEQTAEGTAEPTLPGLFSFTILTPDSPNLVGLTQEIANQWSGLGLNVDVEAVDLPTYSARLEAHEFDAALIEYSLGGSADPDLYAFWHQGQYPDGKNYGGADDRRISELLERARREPFGINRAHAYQDFQEAFVERAIALPLYYPLYTYVVASRVQGIQLGFIGSPSDRFRNIGEWSITG